MAVAEGRTGQLVAGIGQPGIAQGGVVTYFGFVHEDGNIILRFNCTASLQEMDRIVVCVIRTIRRTDPRTIIMKLGTKERGDKMRGILHIVFQGDGDVETRQNAIVEALYQALPPVRTIRPPSHE